MGPCVLSPVDILGFISWGVSLLMASSLSWRQATDVQKPETPPTLAREFWQYLYWQDILAQKAGHMLL